VWELDEFEVWGYTLEQTGAGFTTQSSGSPVEQEAESEKQEAVH
jgi:hypothetical protein